MLNPKDNQKALQLLCAKLIAELQIRISDKADSSLPEWESEAIKLGVVLESKE